MRRMNKVFMSARKGQSLVEVLIAITIGVFVILVAAAIIAPTIRRGGELRRAQTANGIARELLENVRVFVESDWHVVDALAAGEHYYLTTTTLPAVFATSVGTESLLVGSTTFERYFYLEDVGRSSGEIVAPPGGTNDSSTKKLVVVYGWANSGSSTLTQYISRSKNKTFFQTDWSGGPHPTSSPVSSTIKFATSVNIDYTSSTGGIIIKDL